MTLTMKQHILLTALILTALTSFTQQKYFEGEITYHVAINSKSQNLSDKDAYKVLATGETLVFTIKNGNYKRRSDLAEEYIISKDKKQYVKFKNLDTLYYMDFAFDTTKVLDIIKDSGTYKVNNYDCKSITLKTAKATKLFLYAPSLLLNPEYDKDNTVAQYNIFSRESGGALWLFARTDYSFLREIDSAIKVDPKAIDDHIFDLPALPKKELSPLSLITFAKFRGGNGAWLKYLNSSLDEKVAAKYVKLPKGQKEASQKVIVEFTVSADGSVSNPHVVNEKEVNPHLAKEALRVITESPRWQPATYYGQKIASNTFQPIVFMVQSE